MEISKHTVTIPAADYEELMKAKELIGLKLLTKDTPLYGAIKQAMEAEYMRQAYKGPSVDVMDLFDVYIKSTR